MQPQRYLRCLGQPILFAPSGEPVRFRTRKHLALLVYISVEGRSLRRDRLAELLWPNVSPAEARHSLATALSILRPRLGLDALETSRDHVRLIPGSIALDLERLQSGDVLGSEVTSPLEVAGFLEGFDIPDSTEFTHWKDRQQARLLPVIKDALVVLIDRCRRTGDTRQIEQLADRMLALDDLCEDAIRAKMEARAFAGDRLTALEIFEAWKKKLAEELQAAPTDLVEGMAVRLRRRGWERTTLANIPNVPTDQWRGRPFIGRTAEYRLLYEMWERVEKGLPGHALVLGDSGVGKTTIVQRLTTAAGLEGAAVSRVQCYDLERDIPYSTLSGLIMGLLDRPGVSATSPESLAELSRTVPQLRQRFPHLPAPSQCEGETARLRLTNAYLEMLTVISEEHPVILVVDDLHLADDVSLAALHLIMRQVRGKPVMVLLIARPGELAQSYNGAQLRENATALAITEVDIKPLTEVESREMLGSVIHPEEKQPSVSEQRALLRAAGGFPMVLELLTEDWRSSGEHSLALSLDAMTAELKTDESAHASYSHILQRITRSLSNTTHNVLNLASILGPRLNDLTMYALVDLTTGQTMTGMAELVDRRVLRDGPRGLEFINELIRGAAYVSVSPSLRRVLHAKIADCFIQEQLHGSDDLWLPIAWHCMRAGRTQEATGYLLRGAREAMHKGAVHAAERALSTALPYLKLSEERSEALLLLVEILQEQGRWADSLEVLQQLDPEQNVSLILVLSVAAECRSTFLSAEQMRARLLQLRELLQSCTDLAISVKAANVVAFLAVLLRDFQLTRDLLTCIEDIPVENLSMHELACVANCKARLMYLASERPPRLHQILDLTAQMRTEGHVNSTMGSLQTDIGTFACCEGRYGDGKAAFLVAHDIYSGLGNDTSRAHQAAQVALCCFRLGQYDEAIRWSLSALSSAGPQFSGYSECQTALYSGASYAILGECTKAMEAVRLLDSRLRESAPLWMRQAWGLHKADILLLVGELSSALSTAHGAVCLGSGVLHSSFFAGPFARWTALIAKSTHKETEARAQVTRMLQKLDRYDAIDQVEILCAGRILWLDPTSSADERTLIEKKLADLPASITEQLARLRMLR